MLVGFFFLQVQRFYESLRRRENTTFMNPIFPLIPPPQKLICTLFLILIFGTSLAQTSYDTYKYEDVLILKNGWIIRGEITKREANGKVTIASSGRNVFVFNLDEIEQIRTELKPKRFRKADRPIIPRKDLIYKEKGLYHAIHAGFLVQNADSPYERSNGTMTVQTSHGYRFNRYLGLGAGVGLSMIRQGHTVPIFGEIRGDVLKTPVTPHYYVQGGYNLPAFARDPRTEWSPEGPIEVQTDVTGGRMFEGGFGIRIHTASQLSWILTLGYREQVIRESTEYPWGFSESTEIIYRRISFQVGMLF